MRKSVRQWRRLPLHHRHGSRGFTLLEVLVSLLVLSIGLIGVAGLQLLGVSNSRDAYFRTQAVMLSYDISDRMRANQDAVDSASYSGNAGTLNSNCRSTTGCTPAQMAGDDVALWKLALAALPGGEGVVCIDSTFDDGSGEGSPACDGVGNQYAVKVWWDDDRNAATDKERLVTVVVP
ncbi:MAG: type IV pilus modification protein PilV [Gammaproteobacteria bacterium]|nr:type IV pilus modification protein PilV [Gammaproteobacteria bacterium]